MKKILLKFSLQVILFDLLYFLMIIVKKYNSIENLWISMAGFVVFHSIFLLNLFNQVHDRFPEQYDE
ncbi:hypothetical protein [Streptococcus cuniculipharyngis]|uniref:Uncharacterized protein n=1 Tax=Streptococcus cuniculipharyngis TaxID=1562651 RepID=A0A5C5SDL0_9STRE|nr:hypothetical protein [Streptococcus cuniculipharyngis]TWS99187.1 hypothetical protein FRX57_03040 [Streptococcus cuniculipharyngis]